MNKLKIPSYVLEELEAVFPEQVGTTDTAELLVNSGKRMVIHYLRDRIKRQETRVHERELGV
jgi:hypothetical protein